MRIVIVGGGLVGLCCAYELSRAGADVSVVERDRCGNATSRGNAGWIVPSMSAPLPAPGVVSQALKSIFKADSPLRIHPRWDINFFRWCWSFWRNSSRERFRESLKAVLALNARTIGSYDKLLAAGVEFEMHSTGLLIAALSEKRLEEYAALMELVKTSGYQGEVDLLGGKEVRSLEPALSDTVIGGVHAKDDRHVRPESLVAGLVRSLRTGGVQIIEDTEVHGIARGGRDSWRLRTSGEDLAADRVVIAAGMHSADLLTRLGRRLPLEAGKGYSLTASGKGTRPLHALKLAEANVACTPFAGGVRMSGMFELGGKDLRVNQSHLGRVVRSASAYLRDWTMDEPEFEWAGMRPSTPDDLPVIGAVPGLDHLYLATGHGSLGVTLAPATAAALAPLVLEGRSSAELEPFSPDRFHRSPGGWQWQR